MRVVFDPSVLVAAARSRQGAKIRRKGIAPQITQMEADEEFWNRRKRRQQRRNSEKKLCSLCLLLFRVFLICVNRRLSVQGGTMLLRGS